MEPNPFIFPRGLKKNRKVKNSKGWEKNKNINTVECYLGINVQWSFKKRRKKERNDDIVWLKKKLAEKR